MICWYLEEDGNYKTQFIRDTKSKPKKPKSELGHKYDILLYNEDTNQVEGFSAIIGDCAGYIERMCAMGYGGLMTKQTSKTNPRIKPVLQALLKVAFGLDQRSYNKLLKPK